MPRRPLPYNLHNGPWGIGPSLAPMERPAHTAVIGSIMVAWPSVLHVAGLYWASSLEEIAKVAWSFFQPFKTPVHVAMF